MEKAVEVAAALIFENGRFLVGKRPAQKSSGNLWEFVGGKAEAGETLRQALVRECREELDVTVTVGEAFYELTHAYPDITVHLTLFYASIVQGQPKRKEHAELRWITPEEIPFYPFCPADDGILAKIQAVHGAPQAVKDVRAQLFSLRLPVPIRQRRFWQRCPTPILTKTTCMLSFWNRAGILMRPWPRWRPFCPMWTIGRPVTR